MGSESPFLHGGGGTNGIVQHPFGSLDKGLSTLIFIWQNESRASLHFASVLYLISFLACSRLIQS